MPQTEIDRLLEPQDAAELLGVDKGTLRYWRHVNFGPPFVKLSDGPKGRVRYPLFDLWEWVCRRVRRPSGRLETQVRTKKKGQE